MDRCPRIPGPRRPSAPSPWFRLGRAGPASGAAALEARPDPGVRVRPGDRLGDSDIRAASRVSQRPRRRPRGRPAPTVTLGWAHGPGGWDRRTAARARARPAPPRLRLQGSTSLTLSLILSLSLSLSRSLSVSLAHSLASSLSPSLLPSLSLVQSFSLSPSSSLSGCCVTLAPLAPPRLHPP